MVNHEEKMKNRALLLLFAAIGLLLCACQGNAAATAASTPTDIPTMPPATATNLPVTETPSPEPTSTLSPTPSAPRGTLSLAHKFGFGSGIRLSPFGLQLSADEKRLIAATSAGVFVFSADDLRLLAAIYEPTQQSGYPLRRHMRVSQDGSLAAGFSINTDYILTIKFWDTSTGSLLAEYALESETGDDLLNMVDFAISPDNTRVAAVSDNGTILIINVSDGKIVETIDQYVNNTLTPLWIEFDPIGKNAYYIFQDVSFTGVQSYGLSSTSWDEVSFADADTIDFPWDAGAFAPLLSKPAGFRWGYFTRWGSRTVQAWEYSTFGKRFEIKRQDPISAIAFSPDGQWIIMGGTNPAQLEAWAVETVEAPQATFPVARPLWAVAASSGGQTFYGISNDGKLNMWKSGETSPVHQQSGFLPVASRLDFSEDGLSLELTTANNDIYEIDLQDGKLQNIHPNPNILEEMKGEVPVSIAVSADKSLLAVVYFSLDDYAIRLFDLTSGKFIRKIPSKHRLNLVEFSPDGLSLFTQAPKHPVQVLDIESGEVLNEIPIDDALGEYLFEMRLSRDKSTLALFGELGVVEIYSTETLEVLQALEVDPNTWSIALSDDGSLLAYYSVDGTIGCWDIANNILLPPLEFGPPTSAVEIPGLAFSPDNRSLALSTWDGVIRIYNVTP